jgi:DNA polymerase (family X)
MNACAIASAYHERMASTNTELARIFSEMAAVLEITGENVFRVNAYKNSGRIIADLTTDLRELAHEKKQLTAIEGIGEGTAKKIMEYCETGHVKEHDELVAKVPPGVLDLTKLPGIGPKTAKMLWEKCGITDLQSLREKIDCGALVGLPKLGEKTIANIKQSLEFIAKASERTRIGAALPLAESLIDFLKQLEGVKRIEYAGSLRRGLETIGDIDLLASTTNPQLLAKTFTTMPMVEQILGQGESKCSVRLARGIQVDLRIIDENSFGAALMYFTGSKLHNVRLRERAIKKKMRLNEYGLFPADAIEDNGEDRPAAPPQKRGVKPIAAKSEEEIYKALGLHYVPPELREDRGEFAPPQGKLPQLIEIGDIKAELHAHTKASDGHFTIDELIEEARSRGFHTIAITDHSKSSVQANGLSPERLLQHIDAVREAASGFKDMTVLAGSEVDILNDGRLDYDDDLLAKLDIVIASPHGQLKQEPQIATQRLLRAIRHPLVHIIGHPTGRLINRRDGLSPDMNTLIEAAVESNTALEINSNHYRLDLRDTHVRAAVEKGALIAIDTDAHAQIDFDELRYGILTARRGWLTAAQCINTWPKAKLIKWLKSKRP